MVYRTTIHGFLTPPTSRILTLYPWHCDPLPIVCRPTSLSIVFWPPTHGISYRLSMVFLTLCILYRPPIHGILTPYTWYFEPLTHCISIPYPWYFDSTSHGILHPYPWYINPYPWYFDSYTWYIEPPTHSILTPYPWYLTPLTLVYRTPYLYWHSIHGILHPYPWYFDHPAYLLIRNEGVKIPWGFNLPYWGSQFSIRGVNVPWMKINPSVNLPWGSKYHMTAGENPRRIGDMLVWVAR